MAIRSINQPITAGSKLNLHKARHWYVTTMMRSIFETLQHDAEIARKKKDLIHYMRWRNQKTIEVYEHYFNEIEFGEIQSAIHNNMREKEMARLKNRAIDLTNQFEQSLS